MGFKLDEPEYMVDGGDKKREPSVCTLYRRGTFEIEGVEVCGIYGPLMRRDYNKAGYNTKSSKTDKIQCFSQILKANIIYC